MKKLIITEKPSVARDFASVLHVNGSQKGYMEDNEYVITWCYGHLVEMLYPESYDVKYKKWRVEDLPFLPKDYKYGVIENKHQKDQYAIVHDLLHRTDIDVVYWAGDSGKEGQTIEENIRRYGGVREGMEEKRVWIDSQTDEEILRGIREAKPMSDYDLLGRSGIMRTIEDYSLGINFSRALSVKYGRLINDAAATKSYTAIAIGRVMTCVLGMVVRREREIRDFVETPFYRVIGTFSDAGFHAEWKAVEGSAYYQSPLLYKENGFRKKEDAMALIGSLQGKDGVIESAECSISKKKAPLLFNLAELQSECSRLFKISPAQTLDVVQELYERKFTTYPRTDARVLTTAIAKEIRKNLKGLGNYEAYAGFVGHIIETNADSKIERSSYTDDKKVTDHYAIIPTGMTRGVDQLNDLQKKVYDLIARRFLAIFYPPAQYQTMKCKILVGTEAFFTSAKVLIDPGYMAVSGLPKKKESEDEEDEETCSKEDLIRFAKNVKKGDRVSLTELNTKEGKTSPPKRYTSGNLILAMENAGNLIEDEELREQIKSTGIGTSATRGEILEKLIRIRYLNQNKKTQIITPENLGEMIYEIVDLTVPTLLNPEMTASWEKGLEGIINGTVDDKEYRSKLEAYIRKETEQMIGSDLSDVLAKKIHPFTGEGSRGMATRKMLGISCPDCGGELSTTSFGYGCSNYWNEEEDKKCRFSVGKIAGVLLDEEQFLKLIRDGKTDEIEGFRSKSKKKFNASLKLQKNEEGKTIVAFDFDNTPKPVEGVICPICGGQIVKTPFGFGCSNYSKEASENSCRFSIGTMLGHSFSVEEVEKLLKEGVTDTIKGFKSKKTGKLFDAKVTLGRDEDGKVTGLKFLFE